MTPVYHGGRIYVGTDADYIYGLDADTFQQKWKSKRNYLWNPRGTPVIATVDNK